MVATGKRTVGGGYPLEAHKDAWVLHKVYGGVGEGSTASIFRKMKIKYAVRDYTTIYDWSARARCICPYHKWDELDEKVEKGQFPPPTQEELKEALSLGGKLYVANQAYNEALDQFHMTLLTMMASRFQPDEQGNFPNVELNHAVVALLRQLTEWAQARSSLIATDVTGGEDGPPRVSGGEDGEAIAVGVTMPAELMMGEMDTLEVPSNVSAEPVNTTSAEMHNGQSPAPLETVSAPGPQTESAPVSAENATTEAPA